MPTHFQSLQQSCYYILLSFSLAILIESCSHRPESSKTSDVFNSSTTNFLITPRGDSIPTGVPISVKGRIVPIDKLSPPIANKFPSNPKVVSKSRTFIKETDLAADTIPISANLQTITPGKNGVPLPETISIEPTFLPLIHPKPSPISFPEITENAIGDLQILEEKHGLIGSKINVLLQDKSGYIWIGSMAGLFRYNGRELTQLSLSSDPSQNKVETLFEDSKGNIWIGTSFGITKYDGHRLIHYKMNMQDASGISYILEDKEQQLWFRYNNRRNGDGVIRLDSTTSNSKAYFSIYTHKTGLAARYITSMYLDTKGRIWLGGRGNKDQKTYRDAGLCWLEAKAGEAGNFSHFPLPKKRGNYNLISAIQEDAKGNFWFGMDRNWGIIKLALNHEETKNNHIEGNWIHYPIINSEVDYTVGVIKKAKNGHLWIRIVSNDFKNYGIFQFDGEHFINLTEEEGLGNGRAASILEDNKDNLWITTAPNRLTKIDINSFQHFSTNQGMLINATMGITEDSLGQLWLANYSYTGGGKLGLSKYVQDKNKLGGTFSHYTRQNTGLSTNFFRNVTTDSKGQIWFATEKGVFQYNPSSDTIKHLTTKEGLLNNFVWSIEEDFQGNMWFVGGGGASRYHPEKGFVHFTPKEKMGLGFSLEADREGNMWFGTYQGGLVRFQSNPDGVSGTMTRFTKNEGLKSNEIWPIYQDSRGLLWIGTTGGLNIYDGKKIRTFPSDDVLLDHFIMSIVEDKDHNIWVSTHKGIGVFIPQKDPDKPTWSNFKLHTFERKDGLKNINFNTLSGYLDSKNQLWWGGHNGLTMLDLNRFTFPEGTPQNVGISHIEVGQKFVDFRRMADTAYANQFAFGKKLAASFDSVVPYENYPRDLRLPYHINHLTFHFSSIDWEAPHKIQYRYKLEGLDNEWSDPTSEAKAEYRNLSHNHYTLKVQAKGAAQEWSEEFSYSFKILPPWWQTNIAYACYMLLFALALWQFIRWRTAAQRKKLAETEKINTRLRQVDSLKDQFLANTSHELRTPLHGIIGIAEAVFEKVQEDEDKENLGMIIASGKRLSSLVNDLLDFSKVKNHDLELSQKAVGLRSTVDVVLQACYSLIGTKPIRLHNEIPADLPPVYADENRLQQIFYNLVGNAIKFTDKGKIQVQAQVSSSSSSANSSSTGAIHSPDQRMLRIAIQDTGIGIPKAKQQTIFQAFEQADGSTAREAGGTGLGLSITRQLVELHGGKIWVESTEDEGSAFFFTLPVADEENMTKISEPSVIEPVSSSLFAGLGVESSPRPLQRGSLSSDAPFKRGNLSADTPFEGGRGMNDAVRILLVDDEPINHQVIKNYFRGDEIYLQSVMSGHEALEVIQKESKFDLVLLDIMMPRMNGYEVCQEIRKQYLPSEIPVIMLTAKSQIADLIQGLETGANDYITKPFSKDEFLARIKTHLNLHRIHSATNKFVPSDFLKTIDRKSITEVRLGDQKEQNITVFFSDIRSYTTLSEGMTPDENFRFVNAYAGRMGPIIRENHGFVNQYLGDGIMALFQKSPQDALKAAIDMQVEIQAYNIDRQKRGRQPIKVGMGMHTGSLIMGIIGDKLRNDPATISDTVNTAARMEGLTKHFGAQILISETIYEGLESDVPDVETLKFNVSTPSALNVSTSSDISLPSSRFSLRYLGLVQVKGKKQPLGVYECLDGLPQQQFELMLKTLPDFEAGMKMYFSREFDHAAKAFHKVLATNPDDKAAQLYATRAAAYKMAGVSDDWTGVEAMSSK